MPRLVSCFLPFLSAGCAEVGTTSGPTSPTPPRHSGGPTDQPPSPSHSGTPTAETGGASGPRQPTLWVNEGVSDAVRATVYPEVGAADSLIVYQGTFDQDNDGVIDDGGLAEVEALLAEIAPVGTTAPVCLDWEAPNFTTLLFADPVSPEFQAGVEAFVAFLEAVRAARPDLRYGYYGLPVTNYWSRDEAWRARNDALGPILVASDAIFPSTYDFYTPDQSGDEDPRYVRDVVEEGLRAAAGRPLYVYVWHRYHDSSATVPGRLIGEQEFREHVGAAFQAERDGRRADGVVWWGADRYFHATGGHPWDEVFAEEIPAGTDPEDWFDQVHAERLRWLAEVLEQAAPLP